MSSIHDIQIESINGQINSLGAYKGKVLLVVNTASKCGFTPQFEGLETLYQQYKDKGLEILGFPCNQFGHQDPGDNSEIQQFCQLNYGVSFPMHAKIDVNGSNTHPLFKQLKTAASGILGTKNIKWNFTKFLIDKQGNVIARFSPMTKPEKLEKAIVRALGG